MQNLIHNALKFHGEEPPHVRISGRENGGEWEITVADNGIGIDKRFRELAFEPLKRAHSAKNIKGTGIGLAICRKIIQRHGGKIWVESLIGDGSEFKFTLPK